MRKFKTSGVNRGRIVEVEVERATDKCVWLEGGQRMARRSSYFCCFDTWEETRDHLYGLADGDLRAAQLALKAAEARMDAIIALRKPESKEAGQ